MTLELVGNAKEAAALPMSGACARIGSVGIIGVNLFFIFLVVNIRFGVCGCQVNIARFVALRAHLKEKVLN